MEPKIEATRTSCQYRMRDPGGSGGANYYFTANKIDVGNTQNEVWAVTVEVETPAGRHVQATVPLKQNQYVDIPKYEGGEGTPYVSGFFLVREENGFNAIFLGATLWAKQDAVYGLVHSLIAVV
jgi:hypothetical protein